MPKDKFNILFWNLYRHDLSEYIISLINENDIDIAFFCEYDELNYNTIVNLEKFEILDCISEKSRILCISKKDLKLSEIQDKEYYFLLKVEIFNKTFNIVSTHLHSQLYHQDQNREIVIGGLLTDLVSYENESAKSIIIGDFNIEPYSEQMLKPSLFNVVFFEELIKENEYKVVMGNKYRRFYSPFISILSEKEKKYGTYFYNEGTYWHLFDQVIFRKDVIPFFLEMQIIKEINGMNLLKNNKPDPKISDHLPIIVTFKEA